MAQNICRNCRWAEWAMTSHTTPRVNQKQHGRCLYPMSRVAIPVCVYLGERVNEHAKHVIWWPDDAACRVWENKQVKSS